MKRMTFFVLCGCLAAALFIGYPQTGQSSEGELCIPLGEITLSAPESVSPKRSSVDFPHAIHFDYNCQRCHHTWENDTEVATCGTSGCHDLTQTPEKGNRSLALRYYKRAYHDLCIGCHKSIKAGNLKKEMSKMPLEDELPPTGPTGCVGCHPK